MKFKAISAEPRDNFRTRHTLIVCLLLFGVTITFFVVSHSSIGITDMDAYAYIKGAQSFRRGSGYINSDGSPLNHWPPGYSLLLSRFRDPLWASYWVNALSLSVATS